MIRSFRCLMLLAWSFLVLAQGAHAKDAPNPYDLCDQGDPLACQFLGEWYSKAPHLDLDRSTSYFQRACKGGLPAGCYGLGMAYHLGLGVTPNAELARAFYRTACEGGHAEACTNLAWLYGHGEGGAKSEPDAARFYQRSCEKGDQLGCSNLGNMYVKAEGVPQDYARALELFEGACAADLAEGCMGLMKMYASGLGVPEDSRKARPYLKKALRLYRKACREGDAHACDMGQL